MSRLLQIFFCVAGLLFLFGCDSKSDTSSAASAPAQKPHIKVGINPEYPPFEFKEGDKILGFDVDLLEAVSEMAGFSYTLVHMSFDGLIPALKAGKIDMIMSSMSATPERAKQVDFSAPYYEGQTLYIKRKESKDINSKEDLKGKRVGVLLGSVQEQAVNAMKKEYKLTVKPSNDILASILNLKTKKVEVVAADHATAQGYLKENDDLEGFYQEGDGSEGLSMAVDKGQFGDVLGRINEALDALKQNGEYDRLLEKYDLN